MKILFFILLFAVSLSAQENPPSKTDVFAEFQIAVTLYDSTLFTEALDIFSRIVNEYEFSSLTTAAYIFMGKIFNNLNKNRLAELHLKEYPKLFPGSKYIDEARIVLAESLLKQGKYKESINELIEIINSSKSPEYTGKAKDFIEKIVFSYSDINTLRQIIAENQFIKIKPSLLLILAKLQLFFSQTEDASETLELIITNYQDAPEHKKAEDLITKKTNPSSLDTVECKVLLVLMATGSPDSEIRRASLEALEGIKYAVDEFNRTNGSQVGLMIKDTKGSPQEIERIYEELKNCDFKGIIAPLHSSDAQLVAEHFNAMNIPILSPTATVDDLTLKYSNFFQANPSFIMRGKIMAQYIYFVENKKYIAIIHASESYSTILAASFKEEFIRLGGEITAVESYSLSSVSLGGEVSSLLKKSKNTNGIYAPLSESKTANVLLAAFLNNNVHVPIYGNQDWMNAKGLEYFSSLSRILTFTSDYFIDYNDDAFKIFGKQFYNFTNQEVNRNVIYGYDAASFLLGIYNKKANSKREYFDKIVSGISQRGFHNSLSFGYERINKHLNIVRYRNGVFELVDIFKYENN